jgi:hypothetical protein
MKNSMAGEIAELVQLEIDITKMRVRADALRAALGLDTGFLKARIGRPPGQPGNTSKRQLSPKALQAIGDATKERWAVYREQKKQQPEFVVTPARLAAMRKNVKKAMAVRHAKKPKRKFTGAKLRNLRATAAHAREVLQQKRAAAAKPPKKKPTAAQLAAYRANAAKGRAAHLAKLAALAKTA